MKPTNSANHDHKTVESAQPADSTVFVHAHIAPTSRADLAGPPTTPNVIVLTGFMGAGKTTTGRLLAQQLGWPFLDADDAIESNTGLTIAEIFSQHGEPWFREKEHEIVRQLVERKGLVLALGGGAIEDERTHALLLNSSSIRLIHLEASLQTGLERCEGTDSIRPVLANRPLLESRYLKRLPLYRQAHHTIPVDQLTPGQVVAAIRILTLAP